MYKRQNPRFEKWLLGFPKIGPAIENFRNGLGMPLKAKIFAVSSIFIFPALATILLIANQLVKALIIFVAIFGIWYIVSRVPTREKVINKN